MKCPICNKSVKNEKMLLCQKCAARLRERLVDLPAMRDEASYCLEPQRGGRGTNTGEPTIGINLHALDFVTGNVILNVLHEWEKVIRSERELTPPALLPKYADEVRQSVKFHLAHFDWTLEQVWVDEFAREVAAVHSTGMIAARRMIDPVKRIPCPNETENGVCRALIAIKGDDLLEPVVCRKCNTQWTAARLIAVSMSDPQLEIWLDAEAIAEWMGLSDRQVHRLVLKHKIAKKGQLINLTQFTKARQSFESTI